MIGTHVNVHRRAGQRFNRKAEIEPPALFGRAIQYDFETRFDQLGAQGRHDLQGRQAAPFQPPGRAPYLAIKRKLRHHPFGENADRRDIAIGPRIPFRRQLGIRRQFEFQRQGTLR